METDYLTRKDTVDFIDDCERCEVRIYGVERFVLSDDRFVPDLDGIADFSEIDHGSISLSITAARQFIELFDSNIDQRFRVVY